MSWPTKVHYVIATETGRERGPRFATAEEAAHALRWARGDALRIVQIHAVPVPGSSPDELHAAAVAECAEHGHADPEEAPYGTACSRCTEPLPEGDQPTDRGSASC